MTHLFSFLITPFPFTSVSRLCLPLLFSVQLSFTQSFGSTLLPWCQARGGGRRHIRCVVEPVHSPGRMPAPLRWHSDFKAKHPEHWLYIDRSLNQYELAYWWTQQNVVTAISPTHIGIGQKIGGGGSQRSALEVWPIRGCVCRQALVLRAKRFPHRRCVVEIKLCGKTPRWCSLDRNLSLKMCQDCRFFSP